MAFFEWSPRLSVGLDSVDRQHRLLIGYINELSDAVDIGRSSLSLQKLLERLRNYTKVHFAYEEAMFKVYGYEEASDHAAAHHAFVRMIEECEARQAKGDANVAADLLQYLKTWLAEHILVEDMAYATVLSGRGAQ
ncbi:MAG: hemerythrin family protein [Lysobacter sp.]|nr:hemerythrin family protein [Lysobacter sp.]